MSSVWGLAPTGFNAKQQQDVIADLRAKFQTAFGSNVNLADETVFGQIIAIFAEREALLWQLAEAVYTSQYPAGAEGASVDNILALNNLQRLGARPTETDPDPITQPNGITLYGLVLYGNPGVVVPANSLVSNGATPPLLFSLDTPVTLAAAANAVQLVFFSNTPTQGAYALSLRAPSGVSVTTPNLPYNAAANQTLLSWPTAPTTGNWQLAVGGQLTLTLTASITPDALQAILQAMPGLAGTTVSGSVAAGFAITWPSASYNPYVSTQGTALNFSPTALTGSFTLALNGTPLAPLSATATPAQVQAAITAVPGYAGVRVAGMVGTSGGTYTLLWGTVTPPTVTTVSNTTGSTLTFAPMYLLDQPLTVRNSVQANINALVDPNTLMQPFTDVLVQQLAGGLRFTWGAAAAAQGAPSSAAQPQPLLKVVNSTLQAGNTTTNTSVVNSVAGAPAQGIGSATCTVSGPNSAAAGTLNTIATPLAGWTGVKNQLDCLVGATLESDQDALARRNRLLSAQANGPLQAIVERVAQVADVSAALGFQNTGGAAQQLLLFDAPPTTGTYALISGGTSTAAIAAAATAAQVRSALAALPGYANVLVSGDTTTGLVVDFNGAAGGQAQPLLLVGANTTNVNLTVAYGRSPKAYEIVAQGGQDAGIAAAIFAAGPAGIATYGAPVLRTTASTVTAGQSQITVLSTAGVVAGLAVTGPGLQNGTMVTSVVGGTIMLNLPALGTYSNVPVQFLHQVQVYDQFNNPQLIAFSRPQAVAVYIAVQLTTDLYLVPGDATSGTNPQAQFAPASVLQIQQSLVDLANAVPIGGLLVAQGSHGLIGAFNAIAGIVTYQLTFGTAPNPTTATNIRFQAAQVPSAQVFNCSVSFT